MPMYCHTFKVAGRFPFPVDMLRYDRCTPDSEADSGAIHNSITAAPGFDRGPIRLMRWDSNKSWAPTFGRWESFGWKVDEDSLSTGRF